MTPFTAASWGAALFVVVAAAALRGRFYAVFASVLLSIHTLISVALAPRVGPLFIAFAVVQASVYVHFLSLVRARMRPAWWRAAVSIPASWFFAGTFLAAPWAIAVGLGAEPRLSLLIPYGIALLGLVESLTSRREDVHVVLVDEADTAGVRRHRAGAFRSDRPLRLIQITDPHLGPFMSADRLRRVAERAAAAAPDLVLLTGDFLTMESHDAEDALAYALEPLLPLAGKTFACRGNHDHEAPGTVARALARAGVRLLVDEAETVETPAGKVQVLGLDFAFRDRELAHRTACARWPREGDALRLVLLHDPGAFRHLATGDADLVLSGHTHGGQLGLVAFGLPWTVVSALTKIPDHGLWARGRDLLYVHRGTGHYGFPLRIGVPAEESVLHVHVPPGR